MKLTQKEWEELIKKNLAERKFKKEHAPPEPRSETNEILRKLRLYVSIPIMIGIVAILLFYRK